MLFVRLLSIVLIIIGFAGFSAPFWFGAVKGAESIELPLAAIEDVAVGDDGGLYFALMHLGRVQVYSREGNFVRNFPISNSGGAFCLSIAGDRLTVAVARRDAADEFDLDGKPLSRDAHLTDGQYAEVCRRDERVRFVDWAVGAVTLTFADGRHVTLARQLWHYAALGPFWSWLMFMIGLALWPEWRRGIFNRIMGRK